MFTLPRTGKRSKNIATENIDGMVGKCRNVIKYNKRGGMTEKCITATVRCVGEPWECGEGRGNVAFVEFES